MMMVVGEKKDLMQGNQGVKMARYGSQSSHENAKYSGVLKCKECGNKISIHKDTFVPPCHCGGTSWEYQTVTKR